MSTEVKNIYLAEQLLAQLEESARAKGKTPDEMASEAVQVYLKRDQEREWQDLLAYGHAKGKQSGIREEDVPDVIHEWRREQDQRTP